LGVTIDPFRYIPPGPPFSASKPEKRDYPKEFIPILDLDDYPEYHEVLGTFWITDTRLYDGHNTTIEMAYYNYDTGRHIYTNTYQIPDPSTEGYSYWNWYRVWSCIGKVAHELNCGMTVVCEISCSSDTLPDTKVIKFWQVASDVPCPDEIICTPGEQKCMGSDLYECNAAGTGWDLLQADAGICQGSGACPDFWSDPVGAVTCWILSAFEAVLGLVTGGFLTLILNVKNFLEDFSTHVSSFFGDIKSGI